ncbi:MAG: hypothetical protein MI974_12875 [Chitinophagales bacterium]|nr:hypothetical protein [Chitinophagales bacterium]
MINQISVILAVLVFVSIIIYKYYQGQKIDLPNLIKAALSASMIPTACLLLTFVFKPDLQAQIQNLSVQIAVAGLVLFYVSIKTIIEVFQSNTS